MRFMRELALAPMPGMTKGEASDLIGTRLPADPEELEVLSFFNAPHSDATTQTEARRAAAALLSVPENASRWERKQQHEAARAHRRDLDLFRFVTGTEPPAGTSAAEIDELIAALDDVPEHGARLAEWCALEQREDAIADMVETFKDDPSGYGIRRVPAKLVRRALETIEAEGRTWADIGDDEIAARIREIDPSKATREAQRFPELYAPMRGALPGDPPPAEARGSYVLVLLVAAAVIFALVRWALRA